MRTSECVGCERFPCRDVRHESYVVPSVDLDAGYVSILMISEAAPVNPSDYYYAGGNSLFEHTTVQAFKDANSNVSSTQDLTRLGVYLTTAVKCGKTGYGIEANTINECSLILEKELTLFPKAKVIMLMGDVAIKAVNSIAKRNNEPRVIPAGSTYRIRGREYFFRSRRVFPSYLQAGPSYFIEKSKRRMIAEDIAKALAVTA